jgi:hypothetical protein
MKFKYLYLTILSITLIACGETEPHNAMVESIVQDTTQAQDIIEEIAEVEITKESIIDFSKFDHYATILTKSDLIERFGKENLEDRTAWYAEGTVEKQSTILTNPENGHIIKFVWEDDNTTTSFIEASCYLWSADFGVEGKQEIEAENGLKLGMSLTDLVAWNEDDFEFSGFGWDYAGGVFAKDSSKIANSNIALRLIDEQNVEGDEWNFLLGDIVFKTNDKRIKGAPIMVEQFTMYISED